MGLQGNDKPLDSAGLGSGSVSGGNYFSTMEVLMELVRAYPSLFATIALGGVVALLSASYLLLLLVAHFPRPEVQSERLYRTITASGEITEERELVDTWEVQDGVDEKKKPAKERVGEVLVSVVVPAYNESLRLPGMLAEAVSFLTLEYPAGQPDSPGWEILLVDDGSTDNTTQIALEWTQKQIAVGERIPEGSIRVCTLARNRGKGGAVTHGMRHARGRYAVFADADGATKFSDLKTLLGKLKEVERDGFGVAVGSRAHMVTTDAVVKRSMIRNLLMHTFHTYLHIMGIKSIKDTQCGFKLFSLPAIRAIFPYMHNEGWIFDVEIFLIAEKVGIPIVEVPVTWHEVEGTKLSLMGDSLKMAWDLVVLRGGYAVGIYGKEVRRLL